MTNIRPFIIAIAFAIIAVVMVYMYVQKIKLTPTNIEMTTVVRATENIQPNTTIVDTMLEEIKVPADTVAEGTVTESEEILGKVSTTNIYEGTVLMQAMFDIETAIDDIGRLLGPGERAVTVGITEVSGLGGNIKPGDKVDVLVTILNNEEVGVSSTFTVLRDIAVLAVGQDTGFEEEKNEMTSSGVSKSVTLKVDVAEAERLALSSEVGALRLALRDPDDTFAPMTGGTPLTDFVVYTPTRKDLEEAAKQARAEQIAAEEREFQRRMAEMELWASHPETGEAPPFQDTGTGITMPAPKVPTRMIVIIQGGFERIVELPLLSN